MFARHTNWKSIKKKNVTNSHTFNNHTLTHAHTWLHITLFDWENEEKEWIYLKHKRNDRYFLHAASLRATCEYHVVRSFVLRHTALHSALVLNNVCSWYNFYTYFPFSHWDVPNLIFSRVYFFKCVILLNLTPYVRLRWFWFDAQTFTILPQQRININWNSNVKKIRRMCTVCVYSVCRVPCAEPSKYASSRSYLCKTFRNSRNGGGSNQTSRNMLNRP